ncbi:hypothetical protein NK55_06140 [Thermosynechococcus sp. NK55a]|jgi:hypothetical protein|uniref:hypothetical protein n=1 Tax=unclassified Thermosynechococcus TaxID=2622553 RepID=UPI0003D8D3E0|nr:MULTISPECIES: hypothetical protein [unclassified Thermosynechococcus]AHB88533.1 hypothetical protein NK55_06140 [Thermosynechococcus sp. NK55a]
MSEFHRRYPTGSIVSDLLQIHDGLFIVKTTLRVGDTILATGMAAAPTLEQAEDTARQRALQLLGIHLPVQTAAELIPRVPPALEAASWSEASNTDLFLEPTPSANPRRSQPTVKPASEKPLTKREPVDLADEIAQTTVEMKRLGWTEAQGRACLLQRYGKRSRQQLSDEELLDFLHFLQQQPSPGESSF